MVFKRPTFEYLIMNNIPWIPLTFLIIIIANVLLIFTRRIFIRKKIRMQFQQSGVISLTYTFRSFSYPSAYTGPTIRLFGGSYPFVTFMELIYRDYNGQQVKTLVAAEDYVYKVKLFFENRV